MLEPVVDPALQMKVVRDVARAAGYEGMVGGQAADVMTVERHPTGTRRQIAGQ